MVRRTPIASRSDSRRRTETGPPSRAYREALWAGFLGGNLASLVKWGVEVALPPRRPGRPVPPLELLRWLGLEPEGMTYLYSGHTLNYGAIAVHHGFSVAFGMLYAALAERHPAVARRLGTGFGAALTVGFHGVVLPAADWGPPIGDLPADELAAETLGHLAWIWTIEIVRRDVLDREARRSRP